MELDEKVGKSNVEVTKRTSFKASFDSTEGIAKEDESIYLESDTEETEGVYVEEVKIDRVDKEANLVFGWANISIMEDGDVPLDWQGDITAPLILEKAAYNFVLKYRATGEMHKGGVKGYLVESIMFTKQKMQSLGIPEGILPEGWWVGFYIPDDEVFEKVKSGEYKMFSIQGKARRLKI